MIQDIKVEPENGYLGEIMVRESTNDVGAVERAVESHAGWTTEITLKLKDGSVVKGPPSDFREATGEQRALFFS